MRVHSNIAEVPTRRIAKQWDNAGTAAGTTKAIGLNVPTLRRHSMGLSGHNGLVSFVCKDGGNQAYTLYEWNAGLASVNAGDGWMLNGANSAEYTKTCDQLAKISFTTTEGVPFYIKAGTTAVTEAILSGAEDDANKNTVVGGPTH